MAIFYHEIYRNIKRIKLKTAESYLIFNSSAGLRKKYSILNCIRTNDIPMMGMRHLKLKGTTDSEFWHEFISKSNDNMESLSPHSFAILSSVVTHLIPYYPESKICIEKIFQIIAKKPIILQGLNVELLNMLLVGYNSFKNEIDLRIIAQICKRCNEELIISNKNVVELNVEIMYSIAKCIRNEPKLLAVIGDTGIFGTFTVFLSRNIDKLNPRELSITIYSLTTFNTANATDEIVYDAVKRNVTKFKTLDVATIIFTSKEPSSPFNKLIPLLSPYVVVKLSEFTPQQIANLLCSYLKSNKSDSSIPNACFDKEINLLVERSSEIFDMFKPQEAFNIINGMIRYNFLPAASFLLSYSKYLRNKDFKKFKMVDLFTLINSLSLWRDQIIECWSDEFNVIVDKSSREVSRFCNKNIALEKLIYILHYISRISDLPNSAIDSIIKLLYTSELSSLSVKEMCLIKGSISKFIPTYSHINDKIDQMLVVKLNDSAVSFNSMDFSSIFHGQNDSRVHDLAIKRVFELKVIPMSLLFSILRAGCTSELVEKVYQRYVKILTKGKHPNPLECYRVAIILSDKGYRHLYLEHLESLALADIGKCNGIKALNDYCYTLIVLLGRIRYLTPALDNILGKINYGNLSDEKQSKILHSLVLLDRCGNWSFSMFPGNILGIYSMSWLMYMCRINYSLSNVFQVLKLCLDSDLIMNCDLQSRAQLVKSLYMLLNLLSDIVPLDGFQWNRLEFNRSGFKNFDCIVKCNRILNFDIENRFFDKTSSDYSDSVYNVTMGLCIKDIEREVLAGLDYRIDFIVN